MIKDSRRLPLADWQLEDSDRLKAIFQKKRGLLKLTQEKIAAELGDGVTQGAVSHFMNRRTALSLRAAAVFARMLEVPVSEFSPVLAKQLEKMSSSLAPHHDQSPANDSVLTAPTANPPLRPTEQTDEGDWDDYAFVDKYTAKAAAGSGYDNTHVVLRNSLAFKRSWLQMKGANPKNLKVIYADGESMWPTISSHDVLLVDDSKVDPVDGGIFVVESIIDGTLVKRLISTPLGGWILRSDNADKNAYPDRSFLRSESNEHRIIGRVIWRGGDL